MNAFSLARSPADLLTLLQTDDEPRRVPLVSVNRPSFTQQLTVLRDELPGFSQALPSVGVSRRSNLQALGGRR